MAHPKMLSSVEAKLHTFSVTIQSLTVKDKQMTLAVFRQLPIGSFYDDNNGQDDDEPIQGTAWGTVRYPIKDKGDRWIVHEFEGILYRCKFPSKIDLYEVRKDHATAKKELLAYGDFFKRDFHEPSRYRPAKPNNFRDRAEKYTEEEYKSIYDQAKEDYEELVNISMKNYNEKRDCLEKNFKAASIWLQDDIEFNDGMELLIKKLNDLPQLFIAV